MYFQFEKFDKKNTISLERKGGMTKPIVTIYNLKFKKYKIGDKNGKICME